MQPASNQRAWWRVLKAQDFLLGAKGLKMMKRLLNGLAMFATLVGLAVVVPASAQAAPYCEITWGSLPKEAGAPSPPYPPATLTNVRAGRHGCYDRLVLDVDGPTGGFVRYEDAVTTEGRGDVLPLRGGAFLQIGLRNPSYDINTGDSTFTPMNPNELVNVTGWRTFRQVADGGSFEGYTTIGLGVRARLPFRVFVLAGPGSGSRLVVDVAHRW